MRANAKARADDAGAEIIGALILFAIFVATIAILNVTAVPNSGLAAEEEHYESVLSDLNGLQAEAEAAVSPGATVARSLELAPERSVAQDFFSFFLAAPARSSGELTFEPDYGDLSVSHTRDTGGGPVVTYNDLSGPGEELPLGRLVFDPHSNFRGEGRIELENGGVVSIDGSAGSMRFDPPIRLSTTGGTTLVTVQARVLNGTPVSLGGLAPVRLGFVTEASTLTESATPNANDVEVVLKTLHGDAWSEYLDRISDAALCSAADVTAALPGCTVAQYELVLVEGAGGALDTLTWTIHGKATDDSDDIRLATGISVQRVVIS